MPPRLPLTACCAAAAIGLTVASTATAAQAPASSHAPTPNATARQHGIERAGDATMGWRNKSATTPKPTSGRNPRTPASTQAPRVDSAVGGPALAAAEQVAGLDISAHTAGARWDTWKANGMRFVYIKASEGNYYTSDTFDAQYQGATTAGVLRGAYHFANPASSGGAAQADYFIARGGGWSGDGRTLPGALDMEWNPYGGNSCYDKTPAQLQQFVADFVGRYKARTGTRPIIYTASSWWNMCMGASPKWTSTPLWIADYRASLGPVPAAWTGTPHTIWQNAAYNSAGYDTDLFNGSLTSLNRFATVGAQ